jgi:dipeptidase
MCDTFAALPRHTAGGSLIFGKNSDREPNEAQAIVRVPARQQQEKLVQCTYIAIPQVAETYETILSKPFQMWGAEMGVNEHGLAIGNEAVFTKVKFARRNDGLTGMDLLRLALERCRTPRQALACITGLLEQYGQDACGGYRNQRFYYHNSFLIASAAPEEAWILETAGRHWAARRATEGFASISNGLTIASDYDLLSEDAIGFARRQGLLKKGEDFSFRRAFSDWFYTRMSHCRTRQQRSQEQGQSAAGRFGIEQAIALLSSHNLPEGQFRPSRAAASALCMHATGIANPSQTTGSMIAELRAGQPATVWLTGTSNPCLAVYKPFFLGGQSLLPPAWSLPGAQPDDSLWWRAERLFRQISLDYPALYPALKPGRDALQQRFLQREAELRAAAPTPAALDRFSAECLHAYAALLHEWAPIAAKASGKLDWRELRYRWFVRRRDRVLG